MTVVNTPSANMDLQRRMCYFNKAKYLMIKKIKRLQSFLVDMSTASITPTQRHHCITEIALKRKRNENCILFTRYIHLAKP